MSQAGLFLGICGFGFAAISGVISPDVVFASENFLTNGGFEDSDGVTPSGWLKRPSTLVVMATDSAGMAYSGRKAVLLSSSTGSVKYIFQTVRVELGKKYGLSGFVKVIQGKVTPYLRLAWYASVDGSGSELGFADSDRVQRPEGDWGRLEVSRIVPPGVGSLQVRASIYPSSNDQVLVLYDELGLSVVSERVDEKPVDLAELRIQYDLLSEVTAGEGFGVVVRIDSGVPGAKYLVKTMGGRTSSASGMKSLMTLSPGGAWLAWNGSWAAMPGVVVGTDGRGEVTVKSKFDQGTTGQNYFLVRVRKDGSDDRFDSQTKMIVVMEKQMEVKTNDDPPNRIVPGKSESLVSDSPGVFREVENEEETGTVSGDGLAAVLGTKSGGVVTSSGVVSNRAFGKVTRVDRKDVAKWTIGGGFVLTLGAVGWFLYNRRRKRWY